MTRFLHFFLIGLFGFCLLGCFPETDSLDPDKQPYKLEEVFQEDTFRPVDLNNDGRDERVRVITFPDVRRDTQNASLFLGLSMKTLAMMRSAGTGPRYVKHGRVLYCLDGLRACTTAQTRIRSTAEA